MEPSEESVAELPDGDLARFVARLADATRSDEPLPRLTPEQEMYLARLGKGGNVDARIILFVTHLRLVISMARKYEGQGVALDDRTLTGSLALIQAVNGFDHRRGFRFLVYAAFRIRHGFLRTIRPAGYPPPTPEEKAVRNRLTPLDREILALPDGLPSGEGLTPLVEVLRRIFGTDSGATP